MTESNNDFRRRDFNTAEKVQRGITLLHISGRHKAFARFHVLVPCVGQCEYYNPTNSLDKPQNT